MKIQNYIKQILGEMVLSIVTHKDKTFIQQTETLKSISYVIRCEPVDVGKLIGNMGEMVESLEYITNAMTLTFKKSSTVNIQKTDKRESEFIRFKKNPNYKIEVELSLLQRIAEILFDEDCTTNYEHSAEGEISLYIVTSNQVPENLQAALTTIFRAIGRVKGENLRVEICSTYKP